MRLDTIRNTRTILAPVAAVATRSVLDTGRSGQTRAGRPLVAGDFTTLLGLGAPVGLFGLGGLVNLGSGGNLAARAAQVTAPGVSGAAGEATQFNGGDKALYIAADAGTGPFSIRTGSVGCWFRTAKRGAFQYLVSKTNAVTTNLSYGLRVYNSNVINFFGYVDAAATFYQVLGVTDVADDRWHFAVATWDGTVVRVYIDGVLEGSAPIATVGLLNAGNTPLNIGGGGADAATATTSPFYGRIDEAFVTADVLTEQQIRLLYAVAVPHGLGSVPVLSRARINRRRRGPVLAVGNFSATPLHLYNMGGNVNDLGSLGVALSTSGTAPVAGPDGARSGAQQFSSAADYAYATDAGLPSGTAARTLAAWVKTTAANGNVLGYGTFAGRISLWIDANGLPNFGDASTNLTGPFRVNDGAWHHVVAVYDDAAPDARRKLYVDGKLVASDSTAIVATVLLGAEGLQIAFAHASDNVTRGSFLAQTLARIAITNYAMDADEIRALYAKGTEPLVTPMRAGDVVEHADATNLYVIADTVDSVHELDLGVAA